MKPICAPELQAYLDRLATGLPHALLLTGAEGVGLGTIAAYLAGNDAAGVIRPTDNKGEPDTSTSGIIRVEQIRDLTGHAINKSRTRRVYIIDDADKMNLQAQNAFLKLLEEPAPHVHFILTAHEAGKLLPTIASRVRTVLVPRVDHAQSASLLDTLRIHDQTTRAQLLFLADGLPAGLTRLASDMILFQARVDAVTAARQLLQGDALQKLQILHAYSTDRPGALEVLTYAQRIVAHTMKQQPSAQLIEKANDFAEAYDRIAANGHIRIQLARLVV